VTSRPALASDEPFLLELFLERKRAEFSAAVWPAQVREPFLQQQAVLWAQSRSTLETRVLERGGAPVGALVLGGEGNSLRLVELVVASRARRQGVARAALREVLARADAAGQPVVLQTEAGSPAEALYRAHGFVDDGGDGLSVRLRRPAR